MKDKTLYLNSSFETKAVKKGSKSLKIAGYANTITKDRAGDVVTAEAWAKGVENYLDNDGNIKIPEVLRPYMKSEKIIKKAGD